MEIFPYTNMLNFGDCVSYEEILDGDPEKQLTLTKYILELGRKFPKAWEKM